MVQTSLVNYHVYYPTALQPLLGVVLSQWVQNIYDVAFELHNKLLFSLFNAVLEVLQMYLEWKAVADACWPASYPTFARPPYLIRLLKLFKISRENQGATSKIYFTQL